MEIRPLDREKYAGRKFTARYRTSGYYDIRATADGFRISYTALSAAVEKSFDDEFFGEWLEAPVAYSRAAFYSDATYRRIPKQYFLFP